MRKLALLGSIGGLAVWFILNQLSDIGGCHVSFYQARASTLKAAMASYTIDHKGELPKSWQDMQYLIGSDILTDFESEYRFGVSMRASPLLDAGKPFLVQQVLIPANEREVARRYVFYTTPTGDLNYRCLDRKQSKQLFEETGFRYLASGAGETGTIAVTPDPVDYWTNAKESPLFFPGMCVLSAVLLSAASAAWYFWIRNPGKNRHG